MLDERDAGITSAERMNAQFDRMKGKVERLYGMTKRDIKDLGLIGFVAFSSVLFSLGCIYLMALAGEPSSSWFMGLIGVL